MYISVYFVAVRQEMNPMVYVVPVQKLAERSLITGFSLLSETKIRTF